MYDFFHAVPSCSQSPTAALICEVFICLCARADSVWKSPSMRKNYSSGIPTASYCYTLSVASQAVCAVYVRRLSAVNCPPAKRFAGEGERNSLQTEMQTLHIPQKGMTSSPPFSLL